VTKKLKNWKLWVRLSVTLGILGILALVLPLETLLRTIASISWVVWSIVISLVLIGHVISAFKWRMLLIATGLSVSMRAALMAHAAGLFATLFLPSIVGGDLLRAGIITKNSGRPEAVVLGTVADRIMEMLALVTIAALATIFLPVSADETARQVIVIIGLALFIATLAAVVFVRFYPARLLPKSIVGIARRMKTALKTLSSNPGVAFISFTLALGIQGSFALFNVMLATAIGLDAAVWVLIWAWTLAKLVALTPVSVGGIGVREIAFAGLLAPFGIDAGLAVAQSLSWEVVLISTGLLAGLAVLVVFGQNLSLFSNQQDIC
jgi:uncharacterized protein (TIRG00374 family)